MKCRNSCRHRFLSLEAKTIFPADFFRQTQFRQTQLCIPFRLYLENQLFFLLLFLVLCGSRSRSSHQCCSIGKGILENFAKITGKHLCQGLFFNKATGLSLAILLKKKLWHRCFRVNFAKILRKLSYRTFLDDGF